MPIKKISQVEIECEICGDKQILELSSGLGQKAEYVEITVTKVDSVVSRCEDSLSENRMMKLKSIVCLPCSKLGTFMVCDGDLKHIE